MDRINSLFQFGGFLFMLPSIILAWQTHRVIGIHWTTAGFFWLGSAWALVYFRKLRQNWSLVFAVLAFGGNSAWLLMVWNYTPVA